MTYNRNSTLDVLKLLASYMVVFIHVMFYGKIGITIEALARFSVPFFFTVSGFYSLSLTPKQVKQRIIRTLRLLILAVPIYMLWQSGLLFIRQGLQGLLQFLSYYSNVSNWLRFIFFNLPLSAAHLWYLFAILYVYVLYYYATVFSIRKELIVVVSFSLLVLHILLGEVLSFFNIIVPHYIVRNFALMGIPFFGLGLLVNMYQQKLAHAPNYTILILLTIGILETLLSRCFIGRNELYIGSLFILLAVIILFIKYPNAAYPPQLMNLTGCSTYIYIFHPVISSVILRVYPFINLRYQTSIFLQMVHPLIVCVLSTCVAFVFCRISRPILSYFQKEH